MKIPHRILLPLLLAGMSLHSSIASASDLLPPPPPAPEAYLPPPTYVEPAPLPLPIRTSYGWNGGYVGITAGGLCADVVATTEGLITKDAAATDKATFDGCAAHGGVLAGYNVQEGQMVYGIEGDVALSGNVLTTNNDGADVALNMSTLRGRVGYDLDDLLIYVTGGGAVAWSNVLGDSNAHLGWVAGLGAEYKINDSVALRAEYLYANFGSKAYASDCCSGDISFENVNIARLGMTWQLGQVLAPAYAPPPPPPYVSVGG